MNDVTTAVSALGAAVSAVTPKTSQFEYPTGAKRNSKFGEFYGFSSFKDVFSFTADLTPTARRLAPFTEPDAFVPDLPAHVQGGAAVRRGLQFALPIAVGREQFYPLPAGLVVVSGGTGAGKSSFVRSLQKDMPDLERVIAVEPPDSWEEVNTVQIFSTADAALAYCVGRAYKAWDTLHVIDSLRAPLFETSGPAAKNGIIMPFLTQLTRVSNQLAKSGLTIIATINPMEEDAAFTKAFLSKLSASVSCTIVLESMNKVGRDHSFTGTISQRPDRTPQSFTWSPGSTKATRDDLVTTYDLVAVSANREVGSLDRTVINALSKDL